jgi:hypothetical protein
MKTPHRTSLLGAALAAFAALAVQCSATPRQGDGALATHASGSRLRARVLSTSDGATELFDFIDTGRGGDACRFTQHADGVYRCTPDATERRRVYHEDAACTKALLAPSADGCTAPAYVSDPATSPGAPCMPQGFTLSKITKTALVKKGTAVYTLGDTCRADVAPYDLFAVTEQELVDPQTLVAAHIEVGTTGRLRPRALVGDDGSVAFLGWYDPDLGAACTPRHRGDLAWAQCEPETLFERQYYRTTCTGTPVGCVVADRCAPDLAYSAYDPAACSDPFIVHRVGGPAPDDMVEPYRMGSCRSVGPGLRLVGEDVTPGLVKVTLPVFGRLAATAVPAFDGDDAVPTHAMWIDTLFSTACAFKALPDGAVRCVPAPTGQLYYSGKDCTGAPSITAGETSSACASLPADAAVVWDTSSCPATVDAFQVGAAVALSPWWSKMDGACYGGVLSGEANAATPIAASALVTATVTVE